MDAQGLAGDQGVGDLVPGACDDAVEGLAGDAHEARGFLLVETSGVGQAQGFPFVDGEADLIELAQRDALWFEIEGGRASRDFPGAGRAWHGIKD